MGCALLVGLAACVGNLDDGNGPSDPIDDDPAGTQDVELSSAALRRLSIHELENTYRSVVGFAPQAIERIPPDSLTHSFDRVVNAQTMSPAHLEAFVAIADEAATTLMTEQSLATVVAGCPAAQIPSLAVSKLVSIAGNALSLGPEWAVGNAGNPQWGSTTYAPDPTAAYTHAFPTPGAYAISATVDVNGTVDVMELSVNGEAAAAATTVTGLSTVGATVTIDAVGSYIIGLSLDTEPDDNGLAVVFRSLTIEGPLQSTAEPEAPQVRACAMAVIDELAPRAERRPLDASTRDRLTSLYDGAVASHGSAQALHALLEAILSSPRMLYMVELGEPVAGRPGLFRLDDWEVASRLSYALCEQPPDEALREAAYRGALDEELEAQARRLMAKPCARGTVERFVEQWLWLNELPSLNKSPEIFPAFTTEARDGLIAESKRFIAEVIWNEDASVAALFDSDHAWPDASTAGLWGLSSASGERVDLPNERAGLVTSPAVLAVTAPFDGTSPVKRGVYVLEQLLCDGTPPPPTNVAIVPPVPDPNLTTRERWAAHSSDPACASCHALIDPIGFTFESFDGVGQYRTEENGLPVDAAGGIPSLGIEDGSLVGGAATARAIASSDALRACAAKQWLRNALGRLETSADDDTLTDLAGAFDAGSMQSAMLTLVTTEAFKHRRQDTEESP
ncbi:MAG: DUF1588 domain-containing protein [Myxococcales bacterium]|nr:DUF1588 domain-containing protein [Myxococcales bacterium]